MTDPSGADDRLAGIAVRDRIISEAAELFESVGYQQTSMAQIAAAVSLSKASLYHYFSSKAAILYEIHDQYLDVVIKQHLDRVDEHLSPDGLIRAFVHDVFHLHSAGAGRVRVFFENESELPLDQAQQLRRKRARYFDSIRMTIYEGVERGDFASDDVALDAYALLGMCNWAYRWFRADGPRSADEAADHFADLFLRGIAPRTASS